MFVTSTLSSLCFKHINHCREFLEKEFFTEAWKKVISFFCLKIGILFFLNKILVSSPLGTFKRCNFRPFWRKSLRFPSEIFEISDEILHQNIRDLHQNLQDYDQNLRDFDRNLLVLRFQPKWSRHFNQNCWYFNNHFRDFDLNIWDLQWFLRDFYLNDQDFDWNISWSTWLWFWT